LLLIVDVLEIEEIEEIDVSPMDIAEIQVDGTVLVLKETLSLAVDFDLEGQEAIKQLAKEVDTKEAAELARIRKKLKLTHNKAALLRGRAKCLLALRTR
jgi:hypothetical protein